MNRIRTVSLLAIAVVFAFSVPLRAQKLHFVEGSSYHVQLDEMLKLTQRLSNVDSALVEPSFRFTTYHFTEVIQKVRPDGSALVASTLDSFTTKIFVGAVQDRNEYFRFNSNNEYDIANRLKDPRALPRAQYLGQTLIYVLEPNGTIRNFENLGAFQAATIGRSYDYDMMHAMMAFSDSLRVGQLLEQGNGAIAALEGGGSASLPYAVTEIHVTKEMHAKAKGDHITYSAIYIHPPERTDYLEGISFPINIKNFRGASGGSLDMRNGMIVAAEETDSATMTLFLDTEEISNAIYRTVKIQRSQNKVLRGVDINIREIKDSTVAPNTTPGSTAPAGTQPRLEPITAPPGH